MFVPLFRKVQDEESSTAFISALTACPAPAISPAPIRTIPIWCRYVRQTGSENGYEVYSLRLCPCRFRSHVSVGRCTPASRLRARLEIVTVYSATCRKGIAVRNATTCAVCALFALPSICRSARQTAKSLPDSVTPAAKTAASIRYGSGVARRAGFSFSRSASVRFTAFRCTVSSLTRPTQASEKTTAGFPISISALRFTCPTTR